MIPIDPQQELFIKLKLDFEAQGFAVYDGVLPPENTPYPFVYLADFQQTNNMLKNAITGIVYPVIHVWHNTPKQRGTVSQMLQTLFSVCYRIERTTNYSWSLRNCNSRIITDTTTKTPLLHGILEPEFIFS